MERSALPYLPAMSCTSERGQSGIGFDTAFFISLSIWKRRLLSAQLCDCSRSIASTFSAFTSVTTATGRVCRC